ncbi:VIT1/CCC1 transporter family protein [Acidicapsa dinghuensis]|uniref:VIT1/CCC1 transporter family protein n=1 Tax=Acidicapsa dinghuensis TaxID=2218256 RepID=A0ABW1EAT3_9BACT|nr:VIT1/CCC1 transporter family protein [Acidicapsa dinghuensis]
MPIDSLSPFKNARNKKVLAALEGNWQAEMEGYSTYLALADRETDALRAQVLRHLASAELEHAQLWENRILELGGAKPMYNGHPHGEADSLASRAGGPMMALRRLEIEESRHIANYGTQLKELGDEGSVAILEHVIEDEKEHYRELGSLLRGRSHFAAPGGKQILDAKGLLEEMLAKRDKARGGSWAGSWIGDAIYGINDGLGAIFGIVSGVSGATATQNSAAQAHYVLLAGLAGMIASALSMGSGAYLAAKSEREIYEAEFQREREALEMNPTEARQLLSLYFQVKGLPEEDAEHIVEHLAADSDLMLKALAAERMSTTEDGLRVPIISAVSGALSTAVGAMIPVIPFFFMTGATAVITAAIISLVAHFAVGAAKSLITVRSWWSSGFEMTAVGAVEGAVTYVIGLWLGHLGA